MINFSLPIPIYLQNQIHKIAEQTGINADDLQMVASWTKALLVNGDSYQIVCLYEDSVSKEGKLRTRAVRDLDDEHIIAGTDAIRFICNRDQIKIKPISIVNIPYSVYYECSNKQWIGICHYAARLESRCERLSKLLEIGVPKVILYNECRIFRDIVEQLESHQDCVRKEPERWKDGTVIRGLNDIGYSLDGGWTKEMIAEIARRDKEFEQQQEKEEEKHESA